LAARHAVDRLACGSRTKGNIVIAFVARLGHNILLASLALITIALLLQLL
jgi:hypothetical protein